MTEPKRESGCQNCREGMCKGCSPQDPKEKRCEHGVHGTDCYKCFPHQSHQESWDGEHFKRVDALRKSLPPQLDWNALVAPWMREERDFISQLLSSARREEGREAAKAAYEFGRKDERDILRGKLKKIWEERGGSSLLHALQALDQ